MIASALTYADISKDWEWIERNITPVLESFDNEDDITEFVNCKVNSIIAINTTPLTDGMSLYHCFMNKHN